MLRVETPGQTLLQSLRVGGEAAMGGVKDPVTRCSWLGLGPGLAAVHVHSGQPGWMSYFQDVPRANPESLGLLLTCIMSPEAFGDTVVGN